MPEATQRDPNPKDQGDGHQRGGDDPEIQKDSGDLEIKRPGGPAHTAGADPEPEDVIKPTADLGL